MFQFVATKLHFNKFLLSLHIDKYVHLYSERETSAPPGTGNYLSMKFSNSYQPRKISIFTHLLHAYTHMSNSKQPTAPQSIQRQYCFACHRRAFATNLLNRCRGAYSTRIPITNNSCIILLPILISRNAGARLPTQQLDSAAFVCKRVNIILLISNKRLSHVSVGRFNVQRFLLNAEAALFLRFFSSLL